MNNMYHNQLSLFGDRVSDDTLEEVARFLRAVKNIGKIVSINVVSDAYTSAVSDVTVWITSVRCDFDPGCLGCFDAQRDHSAQATTAN